MIASGYSMHLYCDSGQNCKAYTWNGESKDQFFGETFSEVVRMARGKGWRINSKKRTAFCPQCSGKPAKTPGPHRTIKDASSGRNKKAVDEPREKTA